MAADQSETRLIWSAAVPAAVASEEVEEAPEWMGQNESHCQSDSWVLGQVVDHQSDRSIQVVGRQSDFQGQGAGHRNDCQDQEVGHQSDFQGQGVGHRNDFQGVGRQSDFQVQGDRQSDYQVREDLLEDHQVFAGRNGLPVDRPIVEVGRRPWVQDLRVLVEGRRDWVVLAVLVACVVVGQIEAGTAGEN